MYFPTSAKHHFYMTFNKSINRCMKTSWKHTSNTKYTLDEYHTTHSDRTILLLCTTQLFPSPTCMQQLPDPPSLSSPTPGHQGADTASAHYLTIDARRGSPPALQNPHGSTTIGTRVDGRKIRHDHTPRLGSEAHEHTRLRHRAARRDPPPALQHPAAPLAQQMDDEEHLRSVAPTPRQQGWRTHSRRRRVVLRNCRQVLA